MYQVRCDYLNLIFNDIHIEIDVLNDIHRQFHDHRLQYACIASENNADETRCHLHVQIITKVTINKKSWFLDDITGKNKFFVVFLFLLFLGTHCNYQITNNDKAWIEYIKKGQLELFANDYYHTSDDSVCLY